MVVVSVVVRILFIIVSFSVSEPGSRARHRAWKCGVSAPCRGGIRPVSARLTPATGAPTLETCAAFGCSDLSRSTARQRCSGPVTASSSPPSPCVRASGWTPRRSPRRSGVSPSGFGGQGGPGLRQPAPQGPGDRLHRNGRRRLPGPVRRARHRPAALRGDGRAGPGPPGHPVARARHPVAVRRARVVAGPAFGELEDWMPARLEAVRLGQLRLAAEEDLLEARLDCGDHAGVATDGTVLTGQQPFRERRWALLALAQYRSGRQADALASIRSARRALGQELGLDPGSELVALESRILAQDPGLTSDHEARMADASCPWKGLAPYGDRDGDTFFGRDADVAACLARLGESPVLVVTGPSGSGKSSLVQAGLVPALRASGAEVEVFTPGADGALAMAAARSRRTGDPLLVIDQFEETFTLRRRGFRSTVARRRRPLRAGVGTGRRGRPWRPRGGARCGCRAGPAGRARPAPGRASDGRAAARGRRRTRQRRRAAAGAGPGRPGRPRRRRAARCACPCCRTLSPRPGGAERPDC